MYECIITRTVALILIFAPSALGFIQHSSSSSLKANTYSSSLSTTTQSQKRNTSSTTALGVWWFGGTERAVDDREECELVAVRIERTSANSRNIAGEIFVDAPLSDVWSILTDYDRLAEHVPNLVESRTVRGGPATVSNGGRPGDGSYQCRLFQRGAQKIIGFEFGASVTMDMTERILNESTRAIQFKCVDSPFFSEFDGFWTVTEGVAEDGKSPLCTVKYDVEVRPRGPVPVAALEWRIREDVPTNLRAVKDASIRLTTNTQTSGLVSLGDGSYPSSNSSGLVQQKQTATTNSTDKLKARANKVVSRAKNQVNRARNYVDSRINSNSQQPRRLIPQYVPVTVNDWSEDETMAAYLNNSSRTNQ